MEWLIEDENRELADEIEDVNGRMLEKLINDKPFLAVLFYTKENSDCEEAIKALEVKKRRQKNLLSFWANLIFCLEYR